MSTHTTRIACLTLSLAALAIPALADQENDNNNGACTGMPSFSALKSAVSSAINAESTGLNNQMWATIVDRDGVVCAVVFTGTNRGAQWPGSRVISAQKAN